MQPGQPEIYKGPTKKQLGLTPKAIVDEGPQDFIVNEERVSYQPPREEFVPDFGGVTEAMEREKQRLEKEDIKETEKTIQNIESEKQKLEEEQPKGFTFDNTFTNYFKGAEGYLKEYDLAYEYKEAIKNKTEEEIKNIKKTYDIGHGHKLTDEEFKTGIVYGIKVRDDDGNKIGLTDEQANFILKKDIEAKAKDTLRDYKNVTGKNFLDLDKNLQNVLVDSAFNGVPIRGTKGLKKALKDNNVFNIIKNLTDRTTYSAEVKGNVYLGTRNKRLWNNYLDEYAKKNLSEELYKKAKKLVLETHQGPTPTTKRKIAQLK
jgi:hypothetical protein